MMGDKDGGEWGISMDPLEDFEEVLDADSQSKLRP